MLFCDVTNFTAYCDKHEPEDVVSRLDALFVIFERITAKHGLDKIKTIGDGFMAVAGLLHKVNDPIGSAVRCGLEMTSTLIDAQLNWEVRMGVHAGPVVAGVVGQERYQFDIWGDTVNVAARLVGMSAPGSVAVTKEIFEQVASAFDGESLGELTSKAKAGSPSSDCAPIRSINSGLPARGRMSAFGTKRTLAFVAITSAFDP